MADSEKGDTIDELLQSHSITPKVNGEVNGAYEEEPMDVDDSPVKVTKKVNSSDINCISDNTDNNSNSALILIQQTNLTSESNNVAMTLDPHCVVPENKDVATRNGYIEEQKNDEVEENVTEIENEDNETEIGTKENDTVIGNYENDTDMNDENDTDMWNEENEADMGNDENEPEVEENDTEVGNDDENDTELGNDDENDTVIEKENNATSCKNNVEMMENEISNEGDEVMLTEDEGAKDNFSTESNPLEDQKDAAETSDVEEIEEVDPLTNEGEHKEMESEISEELGDSPNKETKLISDQNADSKESEETTKEDGDNTKDTLVEDKGIATKSEKVGDGQEAEDDGEKIEEMPEKSKSEEDSEKTPDKGKKKKVQQQQPSNITPRRSSRNVNKPKTYIDEPDIKGNSSHVKKISDDPDIEEIVPQDPLAMDSPVLDKRNKKTVVVNDPKRLAEIASGNKQTKSGKKEPTLVIIDTNSILSGRGPVPVSSSPPLAHSNMASPGTSQAFSVLPMALPAQGMYPQPLRHSQIKTAATPSPTPTTKAPVILPSLTDDMYVVEAPSFIVPYVYEKPPLKPLKGFVDQVEQAIKEIKAQLEKEKEKKQDGELANEKTGGDDEKEKNDKEESVSNEKSETKEEKMEVDSENLKIAAEADSTISSKNKEDIKDEEKVDTKMENEKQTDKTGDEQKSEDGEKVKKQSNSYFDNPLGKFFIQIGVNLVQEHVQTDLLRSQKRKKEREGSKCTPEVQQAMNSLIRSLEFSKETNEPFKLELKKCEYCSFKTESALVMAHHLETPHMRNYVYRCNFCTLEVRSPHDILYHMEAEHNVRGRLERAPAFHQCPSCPFEDNQKGKLSRHLLSCAKKYRPERNQEPPLDFEPPAKIPRVSRNRPNSMSPGTAVYQAAMSGLKQGVTGPGHPLLPKLVPAPTPTGLARGRGRPQMMNRYLGDMRSTSLAAQQKAMAAQMRPGLMYRPSGTNAQPQVLLPASYQLPGTQLYQVTNHSRGLASTPLALPTQSSPATTSKGAVGTSTAKLLQQPSISITPLPRQQPQTQTASPSTPSAPVKPGRPGGNSKATFVICEICDGYIKDLDQLRNHMQWIHKVKIHPKMIYNRPPLNCQKCQFRFFTDQGLERHLLGSHGLVTSSMQEAANKGKDGGRCPVCGRVYQWKLLNHVARDHNMVLKPAHLSYKCTVCTATFGMYKQFENHVYSAHSVVAKRVMDKKPSTSAQPSTSSQGDMLKPLKINDEITIIPQPARSKTKPTSSTRNPQKKV